MPIRLLLTTSCVLLAVAGCGGHTATGNHTGSGTITGELQAAGGPATGTAQGLAGTVTITGPATHTTITVSATGHYSLAVPPGQYTVSATSPSYDNGSATCQGPTTTVTTGTTVVANIACQEK